MAVIECAGCGAKNRVEQRGPGVTPVCGRCGKVLTVPPAKPLDLSDATLATVLAEAGTRPVLVDCWAPWCGPCRALTPTIDRLAQESGGRYLICKLNIDDNPATASRFGVQSIPTLLIFKNGKLVDQLMGAQPKQVIEARLARHE